MRTRKMLRAFLKTCRAVQLLHACVVKFKVSGTVYVDDQFIIYITMLAYVRMWFKSTIELDVRTNMYIRIRIDSKHPTVS